MRCEDHSIVSHEWSSCPQRESQRQNTYNTTCLYRISKKETQSRATKLKEMSIYMPSWDAQYTARHLVLCPHRIHHHEVVSFSYVSNAARPHHPSAPIAPSRRIPPHPYTFQAPPKSTDVPTRKRGTCHQQNTSATPLTTCCLLLINRTRIL